MKILIPFLILMSLLITEAVAQSVQDAFGPPTGITATAGDRQITLSWRHPSDIDSAEIDEYEIDVVRDPGNPTFFTYLRTTANHASAFADNPSVTRRFPYHGTKYTLRIQAKDNPPGPNNTKFGRWSTSISVTPNIPAPTGFSATLNAPTAASREVTLSWTAVPQLPADYTNRNITGTNTVKMVDRLGHLQVTPTRAKLYLDCKMEFRMLSGLGVCVVLKYQDSLLGR